MQISSDTVVTLAYRVTDTDGEIVDAGDKPLVYLHGGYNGIFEKIEMELEGQGPGFQKDIRLLPEEAFGEYDAELVLVEPIDLFPDNIEIGMQFERATEDGEDEMLYTITDIADGKVVVDGNHPLAGVPLLFSCTVSSVRAATPEEIAHGHAHEGGRHVH